MTSSYKRTSAPGMPFSLGDAREHLQNEEETYDDNLIITLVKAAGQIAENKTNRAFMQSTWVLSSSDWPDTDSESWTWLYPGPLVSVSSVTYWPYTGSQVTMVANTDYQVDINSTPGKIKFLSFPALADRPDAVQITFVAGYGSSGADESAQQAALPADVVSWMKLQLGTLYKHRETIVEGKSVAHLNTFVDNLIYPYLL